MTASDKPPRPREAKRPTRSQRRPQPLYRSPKLWAGVAAVAVLVLGLWLVRRDSSDAAEAPAEGASAGAPVPLSEAADLEAGPRRTAMPDSRLINVADDPRRGDPSAAVRVVEFADYQCPSCAQFFLNTEGALRSLYGDRVEWAFLDFPLAQHDRAMPAAIASGCAHRQGKFWPYHDLLFSKQNRMTDRDLRSYADEVGLDVAAWQTCYDNQESLPEIQQDVELANELGVDATPTFFVGGETLKGALPVTAFMEVIDPLLQAGAPAGMDQVGAGAGEPRQPAGDGASTPEGTEQDAAAPAAGADEGL